MERLTEKRELRPKNGHSWSAYDRIGLSEPVKWKVMPNDAWLFLRIEEIER